MTATGTEVIKVDVTDEMAKVKYDSSTKQWKKVTDEKEQWYNYNAKEWANVVLSSDGTSTDNLFDSNGVLLEETKNYVQLVYIPRYAYKITSQYHEKGTGAGNIDIVFVERVGEKDISAKGVEYKKDYPAATNGGGMADYVVHPAFTFGDKELNGIWVGKFETSTDATTAIGAYANTEKIIVKPNVPSRRNITIGNMFELCLKMNETGNAHGLTSTTDPHLMKNDEWGAVAYLSRSKYGKGSEVWINNSSSYITGSCGNSVSASDTAGTENDYKVGVNASTTGNATGVYDMSGGCWEYVAAYVENGQANAENLANSEAKYKNTYAASATDGSDIFSSNYELINPKTDKHYGDAIYETSSTAGEWNTDAGKGSWNSDCSVLPYSITLVFARGGNYSYTTGAGMFCFGRHTGGPVENTGFRVVVPVVQ